MSRFVLLHTDFRRLINTASDSDERSIVQLDFKKKNEPLKQLEVLEEKKLGVALSEKTKVE